MPCKILRCFCFFSEEVTHLRVDITRIHLERHLLLVKDLRSGFKLLSTCRGVSPSPRSDHAAAVHAERYLLIFGGGSHATCFDDLHVLDLQTVS